MPKLVKSARLLAFEKRLLVEESRLQHPGKVIDRRDLGRMKPKIKAIWLRALRRKDTQANWYMQAVGTLVQMNGGGFYKFCCLGVLNNEAIGAGVLDWTYSREPGDEWCDDLSDRVLKWAGLSRPAATCLIELNDECHANFLEIADWIDYYL